MTDVNTETFGAKALTWAMIAGAALLFLEITWSSMQPVAPAHTAVQAATVQTAVHRVAQN